MIAVLFGHTPAALEDMIWVADDKTLTETLNQSAASFWQFEQQASDPDPDLTHAKEMAEVWGGVIVGATEPIDQGNLEY